MSSITGSVDDGWQTAIEDSGRLGVDKARVANTSSCRRATKRKRPRAISRWRPTPSAASPSSASNRAAATATLSRPSRMASASSSIRCQQASNPQRPKFADAIDVVFDSNDSLRPALPRGARSLRAARALLDRDRVMIDFLGTIGIEKGKPFKPDRRRSRSSTTPCARRTPGLDYKYENVFTRRTTRASAGGYRVEEVLEGLMRITPIPTPILSMAARHLFLRVFQPQAPGRGAVLPDGHRGQGRQTVRRRRAYRLNVPANPRCGFTGRRRCTTAPTHAIIRETQSRRSRPSRRG